MLFCASTVAAALVLAVITTNHPFVAYLLHPAVPQYLLQDAYILHSSYPYSVQLYTVNAPVPTLAPANHPLLLLLAPSSSQSLATLDLNFFTDLVAHRFIDHYTSDFSSDPAIRLSAVVVVVVLFCSILPEGHL